MSRPPPEVEELKQQLAEIAGRKEASIRDQDFERAAELRDEEREFQQRIRAEQEAWEKERKKHRPERPLAARRKTTRRGRK